MLELVKGSLLEMSLKCSPNVTHPSFSLGIIFLKKMMAKKLKKKHTSKDTQISTQQNFSLFP